MRPGVQTWPLFVRRVSTRSRRRATTSAHTPGELAARYAKLGAEEHAESESWKIAGRVMSLRGPFADVSDRTGRFQLYFAKKELGEKFALLKALDRGDFLGASGFVFRTKMGDLALHVQSFDVLSKGLQPLPDKWHGLTDIEKRYRQRYVDLIVNPHVRDVFMQRSKIISAMRRFIDAQGFYECETPTLLNVAGGAAARPFLTHVNALDIEMTLRIATELNLKR